MEPKDNSCLYPLRCVCCKPAGPLAKVRLGSTQPQKNSTLPNRASMSDRGFVELVWENGQILMRGASGRRTTQVSPSCISLRSYHTVNVVEKIGGGSFNAKAARHETLDSILNDSPFLGPPGCKEFSKHDELDPYLNYPHTDSLQDAYPPELLHESYEPGLNAVSVLNDVPTIDKSRFHDKPVVDSHTVSLHDNLNLEQGNTSKFLGVEPQLTKPRSSHLRRQSSLQQCQASAPFIRSQDLDFICSNTHHSHVPLSRNPSQTPASVGGLPNSKMQEQDPGPNKKMGLVNFSHFLRPAALVKASIQSFGATRHTASPGILSRVEELMKRNDERSAADSSNPIQSTLIKSGSGSRIDRGFQDTPAPRATNAELISSIAKPPDEPFHDEHSEAVFQEDGSRKNESPAKVFGRASSFAASAAKGKFDTEKSLEPPVASSSVCSHGASNDPTYYLKRKYQDTEETACPSENVEEESEGVRKAALARGSTGAKRGRTAEVHNLSERRRRDKINKKIHALQELIPNCNKVDKASMLDDAIAYLKTLQLQVQIMSMGTGLCMPPMILPTGMQQMQAPHLTHFCPMGVEMGMRIGMGINCSPAQFPTSPISQATALPGIAETRLHVMGHPSQLLRMPASWAAFIPLPQ